jgi:hypothetical protein
MENTKFKLEFLVTAYRLAMSGMSDPGIAGSLGVSPPTFAKWIRDKPALADALRQARSKEGGAEDFKGFVMGRLPARARELWQRMEAAGVMPDGREKVMREVDIAPLRVRQHLFIQALVKCNFIPGLACREMGIPHSTVKLWMKKDPDFRAIIDGIQESKADFFENCLLNLCARGDASAIIFANKSYNAKRGYSEKLSVEVNKTVTHEHRVTLEEIPVEARRAILEAHREKRRLMIEGPKSDVIDAEFEESK